MRVRGFNVVVQDGFSVRYVVNVLVWPDRAFCDSLGMNAFVGNCIIVWLNRRLNRDECEHSEATGLELEENHDTHRHPVSVGGGATAG